MSGIASIWADVDVIFCVLNDFWNKIELNVKSERKIGDIIRAPRCLVPFDRASKDLDRFPASLACGSGWGSLSSKGLPEIKKKSKNLDKVHFPQVGRLKSRFEGKMPFLCLSWNLIYLIVLFSRKKWSTGGQIFQIFAPTTQKQVFCHCWYDLIV